MIIRFEIPGPPRGKGRHRTRIVRTAAGKQFASNYTPAETVQYENLVRCKAQEAMGFEPPAQGPMRIDLEARFQPPASWSGKKRMRALLGQEWPGYYDVDNIAKTVCDACNGIVWGDDKQVVDLRITKRYAETPGVSVEITALAMIAQGDLLSA